MRKNKEAGGLRTHEQFQFIAQLINSSMEKGEQVDLKNLHPRIFYHLNNRPGQVKTLGDQEYRVAPNGSWVKI